MCECASACVCVWKSLASQCTLDTQNARKPSRRMSTNVSACDRQNVPNEICVLPLGRVSKCMTWCVSLCEGRSSLKAHS